jgi:magnesium transporter
MATDDNKKNNHIQGEYGVSKDLRHRIINAIELNLRSQIRKLFPDLHPADQADFMYNIGPDQRRKLVGLLGNKFDPEVLVHLEGEIQEEIINLMDDDDLVDAVSSLSTDDAIDVIDELEKDGQKKILNAIKSSKKREEIEEGLSYPEDSVGRLMMHKNYIAVPQDWKVGEFIKYIRNKRNLPKDFDDLIVVDDNFRPVSKVSVSQLIRYQDSKPIEEVMDSPEELKVLKTLTDKQEAAMLFTKYDITSAPVVDDVGVLVGVILLTDIVDVIEEEAEEDILHLGNVSDADVYSNVLSATKSRFPWLMASLLTTAVGSLVIGMFAETVDQVVALAILMPIIAGLGGIAGNQTLTVLVRNLATKEVHSKNCFKVIIKEILMGSLNGVMIGVSAGCAVFLWKHDILLSLVFGSTLVFTITSAGLVGTIVPLFLTKLKLDPAITSSAFITTTLDALSFLVFLGMATIFIL